MRRLPSLDHASPTAAWTIAGMALLGIGVGLLAESYAPVAAVGPNDLLVDLGGVVAAAVQAAQVSVWTSVSDFAVGDIAGRGGVR